MEDNYDIYAAMQVDDPQATFKKTCVGKLEVRVINPHTGQSETKILSGDPNDSKTKLDNISVSCWSDKEETYFRRANASFFENGMLVKYKKPETAVVEINYNAATDEDLVKLVTSEFFALRKALKVMTSETTLSRLVRAAEDADRPVKTIRAIQARLAEVQQEEG
jgi:hypothetical protein